MVQLINNSRLASILYPNTSDLYKNYHITYAISVYNKETGNGVMDAMTSDKKTPKGAIRSSWSSTGFVAQQFMWANDGMPNNELHINHPTKWVFMVREVTNHCQVSHQIFDNKHFPRNIIEQLGGVEIAWDEINWK